MKNLSITFIFLSLISCSTPQVEAMKFMSASPNGLSILNIDRTERVEAYRLAERHCAKYSKVPRLIESYNQLEKTDIPLMTMIFQCLRVSR
jgi:hypothetical protein